MSYGGSMSVDAKVYVGGLPSDATSGELEDVFSRYGRLRKVWVARRPPGFAFIEFDDDRDAEDAVRALDGTLAHSASSFSFPHSSFFPSCRRVCGVRARVEMSTGRRRGGSGLSRGR